MSAVASTWCGTVTNVGLDRAHIALEGATAILFMIAEQMEDAGEEGASDGVIAWESAIRFVARSLDDNSGEVFAFLKEVGGDGASAEVGTLGKEAQP